jgi:tetratricopeptide (TPR) repeat protein
VTLEIGMPAPAPREESPDDPQEWRRFNDYGVGLFLSDDTRGAVEQFKKVAQLQPKMMDGWLNLARTYLEDGNIPKAEEALRKASEVAPDQPRLAFFWGRLLEKSGRFDEAVQAYRRTIQNYPDSRDSWSRLGRTYWLMGEIDESIKAYLEVLRIDPEDVVAFHQLNLAYTELAHREHDPGKKDSYVTAAAEMERAFEKYKIDENAQRVTEQYRLTHPDDNRMSQKIIIHEVG